MMQLWTYQGTNFSITDGRVDPSRSTHRNSPSLPKVRPAYERLYEILETDQFIWCSNQCLPFEERIEYKLVVPDGSELKIIDSWIWHKIIGIDVYPPSLEQKWKREALAITNDSQQWDAYLNREKAKYNSPENIETLWQKLFAINDAKQEEGANVLLRHPIEKSWIKN